MSAACFVAKAPHHDARMHLVSLIHPRGAVNVMGFPLRIIAYAVVAWRKLVYIGTVSLYIRLIHHIDSQLIAKFKHIRIRRVM